jgi:hypothetical protein
VCQPFYVLAAILCYVSHFEVMCQTFLVMSAISRYGSHSVFVSHFIYFGSVIFYVPAILGSFHHFISFSGISHILYEPFYVLSTISCCVSHSIFYY